MPTLDLANAKPVVTPPATPDTRALPVKPSLVGMGRVRHVTENLSLAQHAPLTAEQFKLLFA